MMADDDAYAGELPDEEGCEEESEVR